MAVCTPVAAAIRARAASKSVRSTLGSSLHRTERRSRPAVRLHRDMTTEIDLLMARRSALALRGPGPDHAALERMLETAMCAPDHGKLRPWRFIIVESEARNDLGTVLADALRRRDTAATEAACEREQAKPLRAPLILIVTANVRERRSVPPVEQIISAGIAAGNILLAAHSLGYGAMWRTGEAAYDPYVHAALGLGASECIVGFLYLGTPEIMPPARAGVALDGYVSHWTGTRPGRTTSLTPDVDREG